MRFLRVTAVALLSSCILSGCTAGFMYNRMDLVVSWYVTDLVSLDTDQEDRLRVSVRETLAWHRETQIPRYMELVGEIRQELQAPVTAEDVERRYLEIVALLDVSAVRIMPDLADLADTLTPAQVTELATSLEEENEDMRKEYSGATPEIRKARRLKSGIRMLQRFVGRLTAEQRATVEWRLSGLYDNSEAWLERRRQWQQRLLALLAQGLPRAQLEAALRDMVLNPGRFDSTEYRRHVEDNRRIVMSMLAEILNGLDARQQAHLRHKLDGYADDLREIAARG